jgi:hydrogenase maturation factor HypE
VKNNQTGGAVNVVGVRTAEQKTFSKQTDQAVGPSKSNNRMGRFGLGTGSGSMGMG